MCPPPPFNKAAGGSLQTSQLSGRSGRAASIAPWNGLICCCFLTHCLEVSSLGFHIFSYQCFSSSTLELSLYQQSYLSHLTELYGMYFFTVLFHNLAIFMFESRSWTWTISKLYKITKASIPIQFYP